MVMKKDISHKTITAVKQIPEKKRRHNILANHIH